VLKSLETKESAGSVSELDGTIKWHFPGYHSRIAIYIVSSREYKIARSGDFPYDYWRIGITFHTNFTAESDPCVKYCSIPSPYYYGRYATTYVKEEQGYYYYSLNLEVLHP
jgi:hypothetical protein